MAEVEQPAEKSADEVEQELRLKRQKESDESTTRLNLAIDAANGGDFGRALDLAIEAGTLNPKNDYAWFVQGQLHNQSKAYADAIEAFRQAIELKPEDANYHFRLGRAHWFHESGESRAKVIPILERAVALDAKLHLAHYFLGRAYMNQGMAKKAAQSLTTSATLAPHFGRAFNVLGLLYIRWRMIDPAIDVLSHGLVKERDAGVRAELFYHLGIALGRKGDWPRSVTAYTQSLALTPNNGDALRQRGFAYAEVGDVANAKKDLQAFLALGGSNRFTQAANQRLTSRDFRRKRPRKSKFRALPLDAAPKSLALPAVPEFTVTPMIGDAHSVQEMLVLGAPHIGREIKIRGYITWIYDCGKAIRTPNMSKRELKKILATEPERCTRPHFLLGASKQAKDEESLEVVEVPRKLRPDERKALGQEYIDSLPPIPVLKLGSEVIVTGTWNTSSPKGFHNSDGLLVYKSIEPVR